MSSIKTSPKFAVVLLMALQGCAGETSETNRKSGKNQASGNGEEAPQQTATPTPSVTPTPTPVATLDQATCEQRWTQYVAFLKPNTKLEYSGTVLIGIRSFPIKHTETIVSSTDASVVRKVEFTSINTTARVLLSSYKIPSEVTVKKEKYVKACMTPASTERPVSPLLQDKIQIVESKIDTVTLQSVQQETQFLKLEGNYTASNQLQFKTTASIWLSTKAPGVILKQVAELQNVSNNQTGLPTLAPITITDELVSPIVQ